MKKTFFVVSLLLVMLLTSCVSINTGAYLAKENEEIDSALRQQIATLNTQILGTIQKSDFDGLFAYFANGVDDGAKLKQRLQGSFPSLVKSTAGKSFDTYREYYIKWQGKNNGPAVIVPQSDTDFRLSVDHASDEMYVFLGVSRDFSQAMLTMTYTKQNGSWRLYNSYVGSYKVANKTAPEWYQEASTQYDMGHLVPASFRAQHASKLLAPSPMAKYDFEAKIVAYAKKLQDEMRATYTFPITASSVKGSPAIYYLDPQFVQNDIVPVVWYITSNPLDNEAALKDEANLMSPVVQDMFPGIADGVSNIVFKAFSEAPSDPNKKYNSFGTVVQVTR